MTITQEKTVIPRKKSALESSNGVEILKMYMSKYFKMHTHAANSKACKEYQIAAMESNAKINT